MGKPGWPLLMPTGKCAEHQGHQARGGHTGHTGAGHWLILNTDIKYAELYGVHGMYPA